MSFTVRPVTSRLVARITGRRWGEDAISTEMVAPGVDRHSTPALSLPDDPDRILGYQLQTTAELNDVRVNGGVITHGPTLLHRFRNAIIVDGVVHTKSNLTHVARAARRRPVALGPCVEFDTAMLCTNSVIDRFFGHWLIDGQLLEMLAQERHLTSLTVSGHRWLHEPGYRKITGLQDERASFVRIRDLTIADDRGFNDGWQMRAQALRERIRRHCRRTDPAPVFISRGSTGIGRTLINEREVVDALTRIGFVNLQPEHDDPATIAAVLANAPIIVAVEGSAHNHALVAAPPGACLISIMPPREMNAIAKTQADALGLRWAYTVADDAGEGRFSQPADRLRRLIDVVA